MAKRKVSKVNMYDAERKFEHYIDEALKYKNRHIKKPISWALYQTWKWADFNEREREVKKNDRI